MNKCKNCKYFQRNDNEYSNNKYGQCKSDKFIYGDSFDDNDDNNESKSNKLFYMDYEWYNAYIEVGENFGCVHFLEKDK